MMLQPQDDNKSRSRWAKFDTSSESDGDLDYEL